MTAPTTCNYDIRSRFLLAAALLLAGLLPIFLSGCGDVDGQTADAAAEKEPQPAEGEEADQKSPPDDPTAAPDEGKGRPAADGEAAPAEDVPLDDEFPFQMRRSAPDLSGGVDWLNTAGPIDIKDLRGKWVLLDFWTYCCINCMHILPELKKLEEAHPNDLVVIGVHSAKFDTEKETDNIREAILRHGIVHPVVNDADHRIWDRYFVRSWPSLRLIDPEGNLVGGHSGEITAEDLDRVISSATPYYKKKGTLDTTPLSFKLEQRKPRPLHFPGKVLADEASGRLFITDSSHNRIVVTKLDGTLLDVIGDGQPGKKDGGYGTAQFDHPQGTFLLGETLYVADTENHLLRKVDLAAKAVTTVAGTGQQRRSGLWPGIKPDKDGILKLPERFTDVPLETELNSPWALQVHGEDLFIAMAGPHQIWKMPLDESEIGPVAGNGREDIVDGILLPPQPYELEVQVGDKVVSYSSFAQPSGLATDGEWLYIADSEGASIRAMPFDDAERVRTVVGTSGLPFGRLFEFGDTDGAFDKAKLQHPICVCFHRGKLYVADTYNNKIKELDLAANSARTIAGDGTAGSADLPGRFDEPAGVSAAGGKLYVADTNNHLVRVVDLDNGFTVSTLEIAGLAPPEPPKSEEKPAFPGAQTVAVAAAAVTPENGQVTLAVEIELPDGWKMNPDAPPVYYLESAAEEGASRVDAGALGKLVRLSEPSAKFEVTLPVAEGAAGLEEVSLSVSFYYCEKADGLCKVGSVIFKVPLEFTASAGESRVALKHKVEPFDAGGELELMP